GRLAAQCRWRKTSRWKSSPARAWWCMCSRWMLPPAADDCRVLHAVFCYRSIVVIFEVIIVIAVLVVLLLFASIKILPDYERGVVFTLGRMTGVKGPGLFLIIPVLQKMIKVDMRVVVLDVPKQDVISRDNVSVHVN